MDSGSGQQAGEEAHLLRPRRPVFSSKEWEETPWSPVRQNCSFQPSSTSLPALASAQHTLPGTKTHSIWLGQARPPRHLQPGQFLSNAFPLAAFVLRVKGVLASHAADGKAIG